MNPQTVCCVLHSVFQCCGCVRAEPIGAGGNDVHFIWRGDLEGAWLESQVHTDYPD